MTNKPTFAGVETRIHDAIKKAVDDGYERINLCWYVTDESVIEFQRCWAYRERGFNLPNPTGTLWGMIDNIWVHSDPNLKGKIAELRPIVGSDYAITLDFSEQTN